MRNSSARLAVRPFLAVEADAGTPIITGFVEGGVDADEARERIKPEHPQTRLSCGIRHDDSVAEGIGGEPMSNLAVIKLDPRDLYGPPSSTRGSRILIRPPLTTNRSFSGSTRTL